MKYLILIFILFLTFGCSSLMNYRGSKEQFKNVEFEQKVQILEVDDIKPEDLKKTSEASSKQTEILENKELKPSASNNKKLKTKTKATNTLNIKSSKNKIKDGKKNNLPPAPIGRQPDIEDSEGFDNQRRPLIDPFRVGEEVEHEVSYLGATAGILKFKVRPHAIVNGRKSYNFFIDLKSNSFFSRVYAVDDQVQTYVDYETLVPHVFKLNIRDSGQVKEAQSYFDNINLKADYWENRFTEKNGHEEKKLNWSILPYSQNPFSAVFYMRVFKWVIGKEYTFRVADDEKNVMFKAKALEKTQLNTEAGKFNAIKLKAEVYSRGNLAKATDFYMWISDDDRKFILRIEVKLPIGSLVSEVTDINQGKL